jgi:WD40 repeat protein
MQHKHKTKQAKLWDIQNLTCVDTLRGHRDSVNSIAFQNFSNFLVTGSADSTLMLWDTRTGLCT